MKIESRVCNLHPIIFLTFLLLAAAPASAAEVILDDLIVTTDINDGGVCIGTACQDGELFDFDTLKIKDDNPQINFQDTSSSASFPTNDWRMGVADDLVTGSGFFFITDVASGMNVLEMQATDTGGVALGSGSAVVAGAISIGSPGTERPIVNMAAGTNDTDAVNVAQFDAFQQQVTTDTAADAAALDAGIAATQSRIDDLNLRIDDLLDRVNALP